MRILQLLACAVLLCVIPTTASAEEHETHNYGEWIFLDAKNHQKFCTCGDIISEEHEFDGWIEQDENNHVKVCACQASITEGHNWIEPTQIPDGEGTSGNVPNYVCTDCNARKCASIAELSVEDEPEIDFGEILQFYSGHGDLPAETFSTIDINKNGELEAMEIAAAYKTQLS